MKSFLLIPEISISLVLAAGVFTAPLIAADLPPNVENIAKSGDYKKLKASIKDEIERLSIGKSYADLAKNRSFVELATIFDVLNTAGEDKVDELAKSHKKYAAFLKVFFNDGPWMRLYSSAGRLPENSAVGLRVMGDIWAKHGKDSDFRRFLSLTCGIGAAWGASGFTPHLLRGEKLKTKNGYCNPVWRYEFFSESCKEGKLHKNFIKLRPWEIRFVAITRWEDASLEYAQRRINLPPNQYSEACWSAKYSETSEFGDTIQGPLYYTAWPFSMSEAERTVEHGGVCGALSHVGATAASARGMPAYTAGQPGHCAYGFRPERGQWIGGFGGPHGSPHDWIFPGEAPTAVNLMESAFSDDRKVGAAYRARANAVALEACGNIKLAKEAWDAAINTIPHNFNLQTEYQKFVRRHKLFSAQDWKNYAQNLIKNYDGHGFAASRLLAPVEGEFINTLNGVEKIAWFESLHHCIAGTPTSWATKLRPVIEAQAKKLGDNPELQGRFLGMLLSTHLSRGDGENFGQTLEWAVQNYVSKGKNDIFEAAFSRASGSGAGSSADPKKLKAAYGKAIIAAEAARSPQAFHAISKKARLAGLARGEGGPSKLDIPKGRLVSDKGYLRLSSTCQWDNPCAHHKVLSPEDGFFHTDANLKAHAIVELPQAVPVSGILIVKNGWHEGRSRKMKVYRSVDGATWFEIASSDNTQKQWKIEFDEPCQARWIKVENNADGKEFFHLRNILIYSK